MYSDFYAWVTKPICFTAMAPMIFFMFEAVSCMASGEDLGDNQCLNTTAAAMCLSVYLAIITTISISSRSVPQEERGEGITYSNLAILRLKVKEKVQGALGVVTALASMYGFSVLGVEGAPNEIVGKVGGVGALTSGVAALIEFASIAFGRSGSAEDDQEGSLSGNLGEPSNIRRSRSASIGNILVESNRFRIHKHEVRVFIRFFFFPFGILVFWYFEILRFWYFWYF